jgi:tRNA threonylcarbamoyladenosine biosynthesis protein TsaE
VTVIAVVTGSALETAALGRRLGALLEPGDFIALMGDLGTGKTEFAKGVAVGVGVDVAIPITSPTFTLLNMYQGRLPFYHFDLYRLAGESDILELGFEEYFYGSGACLVEWAERLQGEMPCDRLAITFSHGGEECRRLLFEPHGKRYGELLGELFPESRKKCFDPLQDSC